MATQQVQADPEGVTIPPTVSINKMSDKFKEAMAKGSATADKPADPPKATETAKPVEQPKALDAKATTSLPELKAPEVMKAPEKSVEKVEPKKSEQKPEVLRAEQFKAVEKQRDDFRSNYEKEQARVKELEAKIAESAKLVAPEEFEATKKERDFYKGIAEQVAVEHTPEFKRAFTDKIKQLKEEAKEAVGAEHGDKIAKLLKANFDGRDEAVEAIAEELSGFKQTNLSRIYSELKRTERERDIELAKSDENLNRLEQVRVERDRLENAEKAKKNAVAFEYELPKASFMPEFQTVADNAEHNAIVENNRKQAHYIATADLTPSERARMAIFAVKGIQSIETDAMKDALIAKLQTQIQEMQAASPGLTGKGGTMPQMGQNNQTSKPLGFADRVKKAMAEGIPANE